MITIGASSGNQTWAACMAGEHSTTEPMMHQLLLGGSVMKNIVWEWWHTPVIQLPGGQDDGWLEVGGPVVCSSMLIGCTH